MLIELRENAVVRSEDVSALEYFPRNGATEPFLRIQLCGGGVMVVSGDADAKPAYERLRDAMTHAPRGRLWAQPGRMA